MQHRAIIEDLHAAARSKLSGLSSYGLEEEFDYVIAGRGLESLDEYLAVARTGRGSALSPGARRAVWEVYERYRDRCAREGLISWNEMRREALRMVREGVVTRRYSAVVVDEAQDLTEISIELLVEIAGGLPNPRLTVVGDGQQSIYPGGFSLRSLGIEVRGRSTVLRTNWRNTYWIWQAAQAFIEGEEFDDLEDEQAEVRGASETPYPLRQGRPARLHCIDGGLSGEVAWAAALVAEDIARGVDPGDCAIVHPFNKGVTSLESALKKEGVPVAPLTKYEGEHRPNVWVGTFHRVKGLEFKRVYVTGLAQGRWPIVSAKLDEVAREEERASRCARLLSL